MILQKRKTNFKQTSSLFSAKASKSFDVIPPGNARVIWKKCITDSNKSTAGVSRKKKTNFWQKVVALPVIIILLFTLYFQSWNVSQGATYTFTQTNWAGGATANNATHTSNQTGWTEYSAKDTNLTTINAGADLQLSTATNTWTVTDDGTTDTGFNNTGAAMSSAAVSGAGSGAGVKLSINSVTVIWTAKSAWNLPDIGDRSAPAFADLDNDGDYDLVVGSWSGISYGYENTGTVSSPTWTAKSAWNTPDVGTIVAPAFADLDNDGDYDLMIGSTTGISYGYENTGTVSSPTWTAKSAWNTPDVGLNTIPILADLDNDGDYDLLIGEDNGISLGYENTGTVSSPTWTAKSAWNTPDVGWSTAPALSDLDNDGDYDLLAGEGSGISYGYENTGTVSSPTWTAKSAWNTPDVGNNSVPAFADLDNDGDYDLIVGETLGISYGYENTGSITYNSSGTFTSHIFDTVGNVSLGALSWSETVAEGTTDVTIKARSGNQSNLSDATAWGSCTNITSGAALSTGGCVTNGHRYIQFQATLSTTDTTQTPTLNDVSITYNSYPSSQTLTSSGYDSTDTANVIGALSWTEDTSLPTGTTVTVSLRAATSSANLSSASWNDFTNATTNCSKTTGVVTCPLAAIPAALKDGTGDQWLQYKVTLTSTGASTPTFSDITVQYVVNAAPQFQNVTASQGSNGIVSVSYDVRDIDTSTGATAGSVAVSLQYCTANCTTPGSETWVNAATVSGNVGAGITVEESNWSSYSLTWNAKTDYNGQYNANGKIRVVADDSEGANNLGYGTSANFALDTKNPTNVSFTINHTENVLALATPAEDSSYQMLVSNLSNFSGATAQTFQSSYAYGSLTSDPATVYLRIIDARGNYTDATATTPAKPQNIVYYDTTNASLSEYREFVAWGVISASQVGSGFSAYKVYRSTDNTTFSLISTIADRTVNYYLDTGLSAGTVYYYKVRTEDTNGNISAYSGTINDTPDGQGGSDSTAPTISDVAVSNITTTSATVAWTTDELSDSSVGYSTDTSYLPEHGNASMVTSHSITLTGLTPETAYNIRLKSRDSSSNLGQVDASSPGSNPIPDFAFSTLPGPAISNVTVPSLSNNQATIVWRTDIDSSTYVTYGTAVSNGSITNGTEVGTTALIGGSAPFTHTKTLTNLTQGTQYYFSVKSIDSGNNTAVDNNGGNFYQFTTTVDTANPVISGLSVIIKSDTEAAISWTTDEPATSQVKYSLTSGGPYTSTTISSTYDTSHYVILTGLTANTRYYYQVVSQDINTNSATSSESSFTTKKSPAYQHDPLTAISSISDPPDVLTDTKAVITFDTDQAAKCAVESGTQSGSYTEVPLSETDYNLEHSIHLTGLIFSTKYYYRITCADNLDNTVSSSEKSFTTSEKLYTESGVDALSDTTAPDVTNVKMKEITGESVTVTWDTYEKANSLVKYGITKDYERMEGNNLVNSDADNYVTSHKVIISKLIPSTKYYYAVVSADAAGNISESEQKTFTTSSPSSLSSIKVVSKNINEAVVTWKTLEETTSIVEYGLTEEYSEKKESTALAKEHEITLSSLNSGVTYHFRVKGQDKDNNLYSSTDYVFEPKSPPKVSEAKVEEVKEHSVSIVFTTDVPTDALIIYADKDNTYSGSQGNPQLSITHKLELKNLVSGTIYTTRVKVRDESGNESEEVGPEFTTGKDENPPRIDQVRTDNALAQNDKVQTIISWITDEPGTTILIYKESRTGQEKEITISKSFTPSHVAVITSFKPGQVYYFKVKSLDEAGNTALSGEYALLTPKRKENVVQVIINNFQDIFGWMR